MRVVTSRASTVVSNVLSVHGGHEESSELQNVRLAKALRPLI